MTAMNLQDECYRRLVGLIKSLPPLLQEEVVGRSVQSIRDEAKKEFIKELQEEVNTQLIPAARAVALSQLPPVISPVVATAAAVVANTFDYEFQLREYVYEEDEDEPGAWNEDMDPDEWEALVDSYRGRR